MNQESIQLLNTLLVTLDNLQRHANQVNHATTTPDDQIGYYAGQASAYRDAARMVKSVLAVAEKRRTKQREVPMSKTIGHWFQCTEPGCNADFESAEHPQDVKCPNNPNHWLRSRKIIKCDCGAELTLISSWSNGCDCGREYNSAGQELAPRRFWGEETGEVFEQYCKNDQED